MTASGARGKLGACCDTPGGGACIGAPIVLITSGAGLGCDVARGARRAGGRPCRGDHAAGGQRAAGGAAGPGGAVGVAVNKIGNTPPSPVPGPASPRHSAGDPVRPSPTLFSGQEPGPLRWAAVGTVVIFGSALPLLSRPGPVFDTTSLGSTSPPPHRLHRSPSPSPSPSPPDANASTPSPEHGPTTRSEDPRWRPVHLRQHSAPDAASARAGRAAVRVRRTVLVCQERRSGDRCRSRTTSSRSTPWMSGARRR